MCTFYFDIGGDNLPVNRLFVKLEMGRLAVFFKVLTHNGVHLQVLQAIF